MYYTTEQIERIKQSVPIAVVLSRHGSEPVMVGPRFLSYISPFRQETEPSFHVNPHKNLYVDSGDDNRGGNVINLTMQLFGYDFTQACEYLETLAGGCIHEYTPINLVSLPVRPTNPPTRGDEQEEAPETVQYDYIDEKPIRTYSILKYLESKRIHLSTAERY